MMVVATTKKNSHNSASSNSSSNNHSNSSNIESKRNIANELSAKLTAKQATKIKKQLNAILEKTSKNAAGPKNENGHNTGGGANKTSAADKTSNNTKAMDNSINAKQQTTGATTQNNHRNHHNHSHHHHHLNHHSHNHRHIPHHHHAIPLTVEPAAPLEQTEKLEIKLEESPQHRELQLTLLRAAHGQSPHYGEMDFESKLAASKISNALAMAKLNASECTPPPPSPLTNKEKSHKRDENADEKESFNKKESLQKLNKLNDKEELKSTTINNNCKEKRDIDDEEDDKKITCDTINENQRSDDKDHQMEFKDFIENKNGLTTHENETEDVDNDAKMKEI